MVTTCRKLALAIFEPLLNGYDGTNGFIFNQFLARAFMVAFTSLETKSANMVHLRWLLIINILFFDHRRKHISCLTKSWAHVCCCPAWQAVLKHAILGPIESLVFLIVQNKKSLGRHLKFLFELRWLYWFMIALN